jgi:ankyrin repeat protein
LSSIIQELLKSGVNVNTTGEFEQTPLHLAVSCNNLEIVKLLLKFGADSNIVDERNLRPIDYAMDEKNEKIINYITSYKKGGKTNE